MKAHLLKKYVLIIILLISSQAYSYDIEIDNIYYNVNISDFTCEVTYKDDNYNSYSGEIYIPQTVTYKTRTLYVTSIGYNAFYNCTDLSSITIGSSIANISNHAFYGCSGLTSITIPRSVIRIDDYAFGDCTSLRELIFEDGTKSLSLGKCTYSHIFEGWITTNNRGLFYQSPIESVFIGRDLNCDFPPFYDQIEGGSKSLKSAIIGDSVTYICQDAFYKCSNLDTLTIGRSVTNIGISALVGCSSITSIASYNIIPPTGIDVGENIYMNAIVQVPAEAIEAYQSADGWNKFWDIRKFHLDKYFYIKYVVDGEVYATDSVMHGETIIPRQIPVKEGYTFNGWDEIPETMPAEDLIINGSFSINSYTITYMIDGKVYKTETYNYGDTIVAEIAPDKLGYTFSGWIGLPNTMPAKDLIIVGVYAALNGNYTDEQGVQYRLNENKDGYTVSAMTQGLASDIVIPENVYGLPVTAIDERAFVGIRSLKSITIPNSINKVGKEAFYGCEGLLLVEWNTAAPLTSDCFGTPEFHGNMMIFVSDPNTKVEYNGNVIIDGIAKTIKISNDKPFRNKQKFFTHSISFTREFLKHNRIGKPSGWEAIILPFDVLHVISESKGVLKPFGEADFDTSLPYWLGEIQADGTFTPTQRIEANKPFIMLLPNSNDYEDCYNVEGKVTFSAEEVKVHPTIDVERKQDEGYVLIGCYEGTESDNNIYALNEEEYAVGGDTYMPGGVFVSASRNIHPFEAYIYSTSSTRVPYLRIGGHNTGIEELVVDKIDDAWYTLQGVRLNREPKERGLYIHNRKVVKIGM